MFEQTFVPDSNRTRGGASLLASFAAQVMAIAVLILIPLMYTQALPATVLKTLLTAPAPPPPPPPPPPVTQTVARRTWRAFNDGVLTAPTRIPPKPAMIDESDLPPAYSAAGVAGSIPGVPGGSTDGVLKTVLSATTVAPPLPPVIKEVKEKPVQRVPVGGKVIEASLIHKVVPQYPPLARQARVQGKVQFSAIIGRDGTIQNLQLISGHPLLVPAARDAIRQWVYKPTVLNSETVEVITQIEFTFVLN